MDGPSASHSVPRAQRLRVLHVITRFASGGSERRVIDVIRALPVDRFEHQVVVGQGSTLAIAERTFGTARVHMQPHLLRQPHPYHDLMTVLELVKLIRTNRYHVVHTVQSKAGILGRLAARIAGTPIIFHALTMANFGPSFGSASALFNTAERIVGCWTDAYSTVGSDLRDRYTAAGIADPQRYQIIRSSIELDRFRRARAAGRETHRAALGVPDDHHVICYVGSLERRKGVLLLPALLAQLQSAGRPPVTLLLAGEGELRGQLEQEFARLGLERRARFLGHTDAVPAVMSASDCLVLLSESEGLAQVLIQALACDTPFVCTAVDGAREVLALGGRGTIVARADVTAAVEAVSAALTNADHGPSDEHPVDDEASSQLSPWDPVYVDEQYRRLYERHTRRAGLHSPNG